MSENSVNAISGGLNSSAQYSPVDIDAKAARKKWVNNQFQNLINPQNSPVDIDAKAARKKGVNNQLQNLINPQNSPVDINAKAARKKWVNNQLQNLINPQNSLPPTPDWYGQKESNGVTAFYG